MVSLASANAAPADRVGTRSLPEPIVGLVARHRRFRGSPYPCRVLFVAMSGIQTVQKCVFRSLRGLNEQFQEKLLQAFALSGIGCTLLASRVARLLLTSPFPSLRPRLRSGVFLFGALATDRGTRLTRATAVFARFGA